MATKRYKPEEIVSLLGQKSCTACQRQSKMYLRGGIKMYRGLGSSLSPIAHGRDLWAMEATGLS